MFYLYSDYRLVLKKNKEVKKNNFAKLFGGFALLYYYYILLITTRTRCAKIFIIKINNL